MTAGVPERTGRPASTDSVSSAATAVFSDAEFDALARRLLARRPALGLALGVIRDGGLTLFHGHGLADVTSRTPVAEDTVFRIGSVTKLFTAIAIMQLSEQGLVALDAPAGDYLRSYRLVPAQSGFRPVTLRHLLTHTAGIPEVRGLEDLLRADLTPSGGRPSVLSVSTGEPLPSLAEYYRGGLRVVVEPGTSFAYTNHGFATLGQIVEDASGLPLDRYLRERLFDPLGMSDTDLVRTTRLQGRLASGYVLGRRGVKPVPDREWVGAGAGGAYSTTRDMARFVAALVAGGANEHGRILEAETLETMFAPQFQPDPRIAGVGLGFFRSQVGQHRLVGHDGILPGFNSALLVAPDDGVGVIAFTNGSAGAFAWLPTELDDLMRRLLAVVDERPTAVPHRPETWDEVLGRYEFQPRISDLRIRLVLSRGVEVVAIDGRLAVRLLTPVPVPRRGLPLLPDDERDPHVFRLDLSDLGMPSVRVVFARGPDGRVTAAHTDLGGQPWSLVRRDGAGKGRTRRTLVLAAAVVVSAAGLARRRSRRGSAS